MSGKRKRTKLPRLRPAVSSSDVLQANGSRASSMAPSRQVHRQVHMTAPINPSKAASYNTVYHTVSEASTTPSSSAPSSDVASDSDDAHNVGEAYGDSSSSTVYYIREGDGRDAAKRLRTSKRLRRVNHLQEFLKERDTFLDELLRAEGPAGQIPSKLCSCGEADGIFRCTDCFCAALWCADCLCRNHADHPLHIVERWSLYQAGLSVQLGHDGRTCPRPHNIITTLIIVDVFLIHRVRINFCDCGRIRTSKHFVQMLRAKWWPATLKRPKTGFTFRTLKLFQSLSLLGKTNAYDFWRSIVQMTDGSGVIDLHQRYEEFKLAMRCFRVIRMAKRAGRGQDDTGFGGTPLGGFCVECSACPQPDKDLPTGYENVADDQKWLHTRYVAVDANFKLKMKAHGYQDIMLADGLAYFVETKTYKDFFAGVPPEKLELETKGCDNKFAAVENANTSTHFGYNGAGAATCGRHFFFLPNGVGDLEKGERYMNMTYILLSAIKTALGLWARIVISYDIACQFSANFLERMDDFPTELQIKVSKSEIIWLIPKFHLPAHGSQCQIVYAFNFKEGVGRSYGEGIEANWAETNHASLMTREMPEAARHETLDDIFGSINWNKLITFEDRLAKSLRYAVEAEETTRNQLEDLSSRFKEEVRQSWDSMMADWEKDRAKPNPYEEPAVHEITVKVCLEKLAREEAMEAARGVLHPHEVTASKFLAVGMDLQEQQRVLCAKRGQTDDEKLSLQTQRNTLAHRIKSWRVIQALYMPIVATLIAKAEETAIITGDTTPKPEDEKLWCPSEVPQENWATGLASGLVEKEMKVREAEADDALYQIRRYIRMRMGLVHFKSVHIAGRGNKANTRAQDTIKNIMSKCRHAAHRYIAARAALLQLCPRGGTWSTRLRPLNINTDLRNAAGVDPDDDALEQTPAARRERALGERHKDVPWIWRALAPNRREYVNAEEATEEEVIEGMRSPYCKATARHRRWKEEIVLLYEEMRRVAEYFLWKRDDWLSLRGLCLSAHDGVQDGCNAYASRQAKMWEGLARRCTRKWESRLNVVGLRVAWSPRLRSVAGLPSVTRTSTLVGTVTSGADSTNSVPLDGDALAPTAPSNSLPVVTQALSAVDLSEKTFLEQLLADEDVDPDKEPLDESWAQEGDESVDVDSDGADDG